MDLNQEVWDALRARGLKVGASYVQDGVGFMAVINDSAMTLPEARALSQGRTTLNEIIQARK